MKTLSNLTTRQVLAILGIMAVASAFISLITNPDGLTSEWLPNLFQNFTSEILGAGLTYVLFTMILARRADKERLIREMGSPDNATSLNALREARAHGWLFDGSLQRANLSNVNWQDQHLAHVNLQNAYLYAAHLLNTSLEGSNLQGANLSRANLQSTDLGNANLRGANLNRARMQEALLDNADLQGADISFANLDFTDFTGANLQNAKLKKAAFDESTILPNEKPWTPETDLTRFTDPNHPNFWRSDDPASPAYRAPSE
jgi:hypothetical protein